jgi:hypothetical protein
MTSKHALLWAVDALKNQRQETHVQDEHCEEEKEPQQRRMTTNECNEALRHNLRDTIEDRLQHCPLDVLAGLTKSHTVRRSQPSVVREYYLQGDLDNQKSTILTVKDPCSDTFVFSVIKAFDKL